MRNNESVLEARNSKNDDFAILRGATPVGDDDLVTKSHLELSRIKIDRLTLTYEDTGDNNVGSPVPIGATILGILVNIKTTFDGTTPTLIVGDATVDDRFIAAADVDEGSTGVTDKWVLYTYAAATQIVANLTIGGSPSQGELDLAVIWAQPAS
jgi:hypothetical protein